MGHTHGMNYMYILHSYHVIIEAVATYVSVEDAMHNEDHDSLEGVEDTEQPLYHSRVDVVTDHKEP